MSASIGGAIKAHLEGQALGVPIYRDRTEAGTKYPYILVSEGFAFTPPAAANPYSGEHLTEETAQVDLWDIRKNPNTVGTVENYTLPDRLARALDGVGLETAPARVYGMHLVDRARIVDEKRIHHAYTVQIAREF